MNSLSWLIYAASIVSSLNGFLIAVAIIAGIVGAILTLISIICAGENDESWKRAEPRVLKVRNVAIGAFMMCAPLVILVPDKQTVIMIGASEFGQRMIQSDTVQRLADPSVAYIEAWLRMEIERMTGANNTPPRQGR